MLRLSFRASATELLLVSLGLWMVVISCFQNPTSPDGEARIAINISSPSNQLYKASRISKASVTVSAPDISTITATLKVGAGDSSATGTISVRKGSDRTFFVSVTKVEGIADSIVTVYCGEKTVDIQEDIRLQIELAECKDIVIENLRAPDSAKLGEIVNLSWTVKNQGFQRITERFAEMVWINKTASLDSAIRLAVVGPHELPSGGSLNVDSVLVTLPRSAGAYFLLVEGDVRGNVQEWREDNNIATRRITILP